MDLIPCLCSLSRDRSHFAFCVDGLGDINLVVYRFVCVRQSLVPLLGGIRRAPHCLWQSNTTGGSWLEALVCFLAFCTIQTVHDQNQRKLVTRCHHSPTKSSGAGFKSTSCRLPTMRAVSLARYTSLMTEDLFANPQRVSQIHRLTTGACFVVAERWLVRQTGRFHMPSCTADA